MEKWVLIHIWRFISEQTLFHTFFVALFQIEKATIQRLTLGDIRIFRYLDQSDIVQTFNKRCRYCCTAKIIVCSCYRH